MPFGKWSSFEDCVKDFVSKGKPEESAKRICGALKARLEEKSAAQVFSWVGEITPQESNLIAGKAVHPIKTFHPEEWPDIRVYLEEELRKAAGSLTGVPLLLDHVYPLDGEVLEARYFDGAVDYVAELNDEQVLGWVRDGTIKHCSIEYEWDSLERVDGVAPRGIIFTGLALLKDCEPGDPEATVKIWEAIAERLEKAEEQRAKGTLDPANLTVAKFVEKMEKNYQALRSRLDALEKLLDKQGFRGEAIINPTATNSDGDWVSRAEVLADLRKACYERVPKHWGYGAYLQNRRLKDLIKRLEADRQP